MTRRVAVFTWLFGGVAAGQTASNTADLIPAGIRDPNYLRWRSGVALNGQCPMCGEMAAPFRKRGGVIESGWIGHSGETMNLTRCRKCNAAFWQDAEEPKP